MAPAQYYNDINTVVCNFCHEQKLQLLDIFLVGSRVSETGINQFINSDYDSAIIIKENLGLDNLKMIRDDLQNEINEMDKLDLYHFKLFNLDEFETSKHYDSFRIFEFQSSNKSYYGTTILNDHSIYLDEFNFVNSILIQEVHGVLSNQNSLKNISASEKVKKRVERNIQILQNKKIYPYCHQDNFVEYCKRIDSLYKQFKELKHTKKDFLIFIEQYFARFRHEFINKGRSYFDNIDRFFKYA